MAETRYLSAMPSPAIDPLAFWTRTLLILGILLAVCAVAPMIIDLLFFGGGAAATGVLAIYMLAPLAIICLAFGITLWIVKKLRR